MRQVPCLPGTLQPQPLRLFSGQGAETILSSRQGFHHRDTYEKTHSPGRLFCPRRYECFVTSGSDTGIPVGVREPAERAAARMGDNRWSFGAPGDGWQERYNTEPGKRESCIRKEKVMFAGPRLSRQSLSKRNFKNDGSRFAPAHPAALTGNRMARRQKGIERRTRAGLGNSVPGKEAYTAGPMSREVKRG